MVCVCRQVHSALVLSLWSVIYTKTWARLLPPLGEGGCRLRLLMRSCPIASTPEAGAALHCLTPTLIPTRLEFYVALRLRGGGRGWPVCPEHLGCCWATSLTWGKRKGPCLPPPIRDSPDTVIMRANLLFSEPDLTKHRDRPAATWNVVPSEQVTEMCHSEWL